MNFQGKRSGYILRSLAYRLSYAGMVLLIVMSASSGCAPQRQPPDTPTVISTSTIVTTSIQTATQTETRTAPQLATATPHQVLPVFAGTEAPWSDQRISVSRMDDIEEIARWSANSVNCLSFSPDTALLAMGSGDYWLEKPDDVVRLHRVSDGVILHTLEGHLGAITGVSFSSDGAILASGSFDSTVRLWETDTGITQSVYEVKDVFVTSVDISPNGTTLAAGYNIPQQYGGVILWNISSGQMLNRFDEPYGRVNHIEFSPDGNYIAGSSKGIVRIWRLSDGKNVRSLEKDSLMVNQAIFSNDSSYIFSAAEGGYLRKWGVSRAEQLLIFGNPGVDNSPDILSLALFPDDALLISGTGEGVLHLWDTAVGSALKTIEGQTGRITDIACASDGTMFAWGTQSGGSGDGEIHIWGIPKEE
jgi:WD40 repeat protein